MQNRMRIRFFSISLKGSQPSLMAWDQGKGLMCLDRSLHNEQRWLSIKVGRVFCNRCRANMALNCPVNVLICWQRFANLSKKLMSVYEQKGYGEQTLIVLLNRS